MTNTEGLDNMNFDVLTEIGNIVPAMRSLRCRK